MDVTFDSDFFGEVIDYDENGAFDLDLGTESDKENTNRSRSTKQQLNKLDESMEGYDDESDKDNRWKILTETLNELGPPNRSTEKWKRIWSIRKYNLKKRAHQEQTEQTKQSDHFDDGSYEKNIPKNNFCSEVLRKLDLIIQELQRTNDLLRDVSNTHDTPL